MAFLNINDRKIHYVFHPAYERNSETLVLIHANAVDLRAFDCILPYLGNSFNILTYDLRGYGMSDNDTPIEELAISHFVTDLEALLQHLKLTKVHLIGWQMGALIGARYTSKYPDHVLSLTLMAMPCHPPHTIEQIREHRSKLGTGKRQIPHEYLDTHATTLPKGHSELIKLRNYAETISFDLYKKVMDLTVSADPISDIEKVSCPILILSGVKDALFPSHYLQHQTLHLRHCRFITVLNASSLIVLDQPLVIAEMILDFIEESRSENQIEDPFIQSMDNQILDYVAKIQEESLKNSERSNELKVNLLQQFQVFINGEEITTGWNRRFAKSLLLFLVFNGSVSREQICETLWPEIPLAKAKTNLRVCLSYLRKQLASEEYLVVDRERVMIKGNLVCDAKTFLKEVENALEELSPDRKEQKVNQLIQQLPTNFLETHHDEWFIQLRTQTEGRIADLVLWNAEQLVRKGEYAIAIHQLSKTISAIGAIELYQPLITLYEKVGNQQKANEWRKQMADWWDVESDPDSGASL
ncbi:alpha/beta fold hydrolase [Robertmurraya sp. DFI.2.37]|uniref:alpha/beta hydrolase n=1 Tax=Robertmurraya sp. DFI.2.37 TaxID=3031819 RepID=UPI001246216C|nr:alpha/beta hydrolase [Robertmurraya sp. DFI.2.37]MDF1508841.1 alpha/beta fold hydrolase [Robertmurraya sp. DFI.2.37]